MKKTKRKWTKEEKERIIHEVQKWGVVSGCRKHQISPTVYYDWLNKYNALGLEGLSDSKPGQPEREIARLNKELAIMKEMLAEKELELRLKDELLKKRQQEWRSEKRS